MTGTRAISVMSVIMNPRKLTKPRIKLDKKPKTVSITVICWAAVGVTAKAKSGAKRRTATSPRTKKRLKQEPRLRLEAIHVLKLCESFIQWLDCSMTDRFCNVGIAVIPNDKRIKSK